MEIIEKKVLANGAVMSIADESKKMAADRWLIKFRCVTTIPWADWMDEHVTDDSGTYEHVKTSLEPISYEIVRERNFIAESEKDEIIATMLSALQQNIEKYMESPNFSKNCFLKNLTDWRDAQKMEPLISSEEISEDDGPADFSACFK